MNPDIFCPAAGVPALAQARRALTRRGVVFSEDCTGSVSHILLPVPSYSGNTPKFPADILEKAPEAAVLIGGNLPPLPGRSGIDLLQDPVYLARNAAITAHCALALAAAGLPLTWEGLPVLILGWGRIGKLLALGLRRRGARVTVAARRREALAEADAFGMETLDFSGVYSQISQFRLIYNTVPAPVLSAAVMARRRPDCLAMELASSPGMAGEGITDGRGLPGKLAPEASGELIAETVFRRLKEDLS